MPGCKYYTLTLLLYAACVSGAIFVKDLAIVFDFVGAFGLSLTSFTLPGSMYLLMSRNERANHSIESPRQRKCNTIGSWFAIIASAVNIVLVIVKAATM